MMAGVLDVVENGGAGIGERSGRGLASSVDGEVKGKLEFTAHGGDAANDVSAVDRTAIPSVSGNHGSFDPDEVRAAIRAGNSDGVVKVAEAMLDTDALVIPTGSRVETDA